MQVQQLISQPPITCRPTDSLSDAARLLWDHDIGAIGVTDSDGKLAGILTDRDICMAAFTRGKPLDRILVSDCMADKVITCSADESVQSAEKKMREARVRRLPVTDAQGRMIGILSLNDLAREAQRQTGRAKPELSSIELTETLAEICQPRTAAHTQPAPAA